MISQLPMLITGNFMLITLATEDMGETPKSLRLVKATPIPAKNKPMIKTMYLLINSFLSKRSTPCHKTQSHL